MFVSFLLYRTNPQFYRYLSFTGKFDGISDEIYYYLTKPGHIGADKTRERRRLIHYQPEPFRFGADAQHINQIPREFTQIEIAHF